MPNASVVAQPCRLSFDLHRNLVQLADRARGCAARALARDEQSCGRHQREAARDRAHRDGGARPRWTSGTLTRRLLVEGRRPPQPALCKVKVRLGRVPVRRVLMPKARVLVRKVPMRWKMLMHWQMIMLVLRIMAVTLGSVLVRGRRRDWLGWRWCPRRRWRRRRALRDGQGGLACRRLRRKEAVLVVTLGVADDAVSGIRPHRVALTALRRGGVQLGVGGGGGRGLDVGAVGAPRRCRGAQDHRGCARRLWRRRRWRGGRRGGGKRRHWRHRRRRRRRRRRMWRRGRRRRRRRVLGHPAIVEGRRERDGGAIAICVGGSKGAGALGSHGIPLDDGAAVARPVVVGEGVGRSAGGCGPVHASVCLRGGALAHGGVEACLGRRRVLLLISVARPLVADLLCSGGSAGCVGHVDLASEEA